MQTDSKVNEEDIWNAEETKEFNKIDREMAELRKENSIVKLDTEMDSEIKRSELDCLDDEIRAVTQEGITIFRPNYE